MGQAELVQHKENSGTPKFGHLSGDYDFFAEVLRLSFLSHLRISPFLEPRNSESCNIIVKLPLSGIEFFLTMTRFTQMALGRARVINEKA